MANTSEAKPKVKLVGNDGNAFAIIGACMAAGRKAKMDPEQLSTIRREMMSGDYDNLLATACKYFDVR